MKFDAYEYIGIIIPGTVVVLTANRLFPLIGNEVNASLSIGDFGVMLILFFVAGHIVQAFGNAFESGFWRLFGGMPTSWPSNSKNNLLNEEQSARLANVLKEKFNRDISGLKDGRGPIREIFSCIRNEGNVDRVEKFNRTYGLCRGVSVAFYLSAALVAFDDPTNWQVICLLAIFGLIMTYRMYRFGCHYAREIFAEFLACQSNRDIQSTNT